jgi:hypothetical protein
MNDQEKRTLDTFKRVRDFDAAHAGLFAAGSLARELFDAVAAVADELEGHAAAESTGRGKARQGTAGKASAREAILEGLGILRRTARSMAYATPGLEEKFPVPHKQDGQELLNTARSALTAALPLKAEFLRREVPEHVLQDLEADIAAYQAALSGQNTGKEESVTASASIDAAVGRGLDALRQLDPIVRNKLHDNPALLAAWLSAKRTERATRRNNKPAPPTPQTPDK